MYSKFVVLQIAYTLLFTDNATLLGKGGMQGFQGKYFKDTSHVFFFYLNRKSYIEILE